MYKATNMPDEPAASDPCNTCIHKGFVYIGAATDKKTLRNICIALPEQAWLCYIFAWYIFALSGERFMW